MRPSLWKAEPVYVDVCFFMSTYDLWCGWAKQVPQIFYTCILAITHSHYRYWNCSQSIILSLPHSHTNRNKLWVTTNREVIWKWDHGGSSHSPLLQQPLTKGSWAGLVTLTAYMAAKDRNWGIHNKLEDKIVKWKFMPNTSTLITLIIWKNGTGWNSGVVYQNIRGSKAQKVACPPLILSSSRPVLSCSALWNIRWILRRPAPFGLS